MGLLDTYESMLASQHETEKVATEQEKVAEVVDERMAVLEKYAELADNELAKEYGENYNEDDVVKLAQMFIDHDIQLQENMEKIAELHEAGIILARAFKAELANS